VAAQEVIDELASGADFAELARTRSTGPTAPSGGDLGWFSADSMVEPFGDAVQALDVGAHSNSPVQTQFGWHVILVEEARDQQPPGLDAVRNDIRTLVDRNKLEDYVNGLRDSADVVME
jgi:peptidyl-prolyl cis-trans isomerase C